MRLNKIIGLFTLVLPTILLQPSLASGSLIKGLPLQARTRGWKIHPRAVLGPDHTDKCGFDLAISGLPLVFYIWGHKSTEPWKGCGDTFRQV